MVAVVAGNGLGLLGGSGAALGGATLLGSGVVGKYGDSVFVNVATGNLVLQRQDDFLASAGNGGVAVARTYNSLGQLTDDNGDNWHLGLSKRLIFNAPQGGDPADATISRIAGDASAISYTGRGPVPYTAYATTDGDGAHDTISWDANASQWTWTDGTTQAFEIYDATGRLVLSGDSGAAYNLVYHYNDNGLLSKVLDATGGGTFFTYDTTTGRNLTSVEVKYRTEPTTNLPAGEIKSLKRVSYLYDDQNRLKEARTDLSPADGVITDLKIFWTRYTYDGTSRRVASIAQSDGAKLLITYEAGTGRVKTVSDGMFESETLVYADAGKTVVTDKNGLVTSFTHEAGLLKSVLADQAVGEDQLTSYQYDGSGNVIKITDAEGKETVRNYDENGNLIYQRNALGEVIEFSYGSGNRVHTETRYATAGSPDGVVLPSDPQTSRYVHDSAGNLRFQVNANNEVIEYRYNAARQRTDMIQYSKLHLALPPGAPVLADVEALAYVERANVVRTKFTYDVHGMLASSTTFATINPTDGAGVLDTGATVVNFIYDQAGQLLSTTDGNRKVTSYVVDGLGRVLTSTDGLSRTTTTRYDDTPVSRLGRITTQSVTTYADGHHLVTIYDTSGRVVSSALAEGAGYWSVTTLYEYDSAGRVIMKTEPTGAKSYTLYDGMGRMALQVDGDGSATEFKYDANNQLIRTIQRAVPVNVAAHIVLPSKPLASLRAADIAITSDPADRSEWRAYDAAGRLSRTVDNLGYATDYRYDGQGRLLETLAHALAINPGTADDVSNVVPAAHADDRVASFEYDAAGNLERNTEGGVTVAYQRDAMGRVISTEYVGSGIKEYSYYNGKGQLSAQVDGESYLTEFQYDLNGNVTRKIRYAQRVEWAENKTLAMLRPAASTEKQEWVFGYTLDKLTLEIEPDGKTTDYVYDKVGNLMSTAVHYPSINSGKSMVRRDSIGRVVGEIKPEGSQYVLNNITPAALDAIYKKYGVFYTYDTQGRLASKLEDGYKTVYYYDDDGRLAASINGDGEVEYREYTVFNELKQVTKFTTHIAAVSSYVGGKLTSAIKSAILAISDASHDLVTSYDYNGVGMLREQRDSAGVQTMDYNAFGQVSTVVSNGVSSSMTYDGGGRLLDMTTVGGISPDRVETHRYDALGREVLRGVGAAATRIGYDKLGRPTLIEPQGIDQVSPGTVTQYDAFGRVSAQWDAAGQKTGYAYSTAERKVTVTTAEGVITTITNGYNGRPEVVRVGAQSTVTRYNKDDALVFDSTSGRTTYYDDGGRVSHTVDGNGKTTAYTYDAAGRVRTSTQDPTGLNLVTAYTYDGAGQLKTVTNPAGSITRYDYDNKGNVESVTVDAGRLDLTTRYEYDARGLAERVTNPEGQVSAYTFDEFGRTITETIDVHGLALTTKYEYDAVGNVRTSTDANNHVTRFYYDTKNRLIGRVDAEGGVTRFSYDANDKLVRTTRYANAVNANAMPTVLQPGDVDPLDAYLTQDAARDSVTQNVYDNDGRLRFSISGSGAVSERRYNAENHVGKSIEYSGKITVAASYTLAQVVAAVAAIADSTRDVSSTLEYDGLGRVTASTNSLGGVTRYAYDGNGQVLQISRHLSIGTLAAVSVTKMVYDNAGRLVGSATAERFDANGSPIQWSVTRQHVDRSGNVVARTSFANLIDTSVSMDTLAWLDSVSADPARDQASRFVYDGANRMVASADAQYRAGDGTLMWAVAARQYDKVGNLVLSRAYGDFLASPGTGAATNPDEIGQWIAAHPADADRDRIVHMAYDGANRLRYTADAVGAVKETQYDAVGNVVTTIAFANKIAPTQGLISLAYFESERGALASGTGAQVTFLGYDAVNRVTSSDDNISAVRRQSYDALGNMRKATQGERAERFVYDADGRLRFSIDGTGHVSETRYDGAGRVATKIEHAVRIAADAVLGNDADVSLMLNPAHAENRITSYRYDGMGNVTATIDAMQAEESFLHDNLGRKTVFINKERDQWTYEYDSFDRLTKETSPVVKIDHGGNLDVDYAAVTRIDYDTFGNVTARTEAVGVAGAERTTRYGYDLRGRQILTTLPAVSFYNPEADPLSTVGGERYETSPATGASNAVAYDALGNAVTNTDALGNVTRKVYDQGGNVSVEIDALGFATSYQRDAFGNVTTLTRHAQAIQGGAQFNVAGGPDESLVLARLAQVAGATDRSIKMTYNARNQVLTALEGEGSYHQALRNGGQVVGGTYQGRRLTTSSYDEFGQLVEQRVSVASGAADSLNESSLAAVTRYAYNLRGEKVAQLVLADTNANWTVNNGEESTRARDVGAYLTTMDYDGVGNLIETREFENRIVFADESFWNSDWTQRFNKNWLASAEVQQATYSSAARRSQSEYDLVNRKTSDTQINVALRPIVAPADLPGGQSDHLPRPQIHLTTRYTYDSVGNLTSTTDAMNGVTKSYYDAVGHVTAVTARIGYDPTADDELQQGEEADIALTLTHFKRDAHGNVVRSIAYANGGEVGETPKQADPSSDRVTRTTYDLNGNAIQIIDAGGNYSYASYDRLGRLAKQWHSLTQLQTGVGGGQNDATMFKVNQYDAAGRVEQVITPGASSNVVRAHPLIVTGVTTAQQTRETSGMFQYWMPFRGTNSIALNYPEISGATEINVGFTYLPYNSDEPRFRSVSGGTMDAVASWEDPSSEVGGVRLVLSARVMYRDGDGNWHLAYEANDAQLYSRTLAEELDEGTVNRKHQYTFYNAFGEVTLRQQDGVKTERNEYDNAGNLWRSRGADGIAKVFFYNTNGKASLMVRSSVGSQGAGAGSVDDLMSYTSAAAIDTTSAAFARFETTEISYDLMGRVVANRGPGAAISDGPDVPGGTPGDVPDNWGQEEVAPKVYAGLRGPSRLAVDQSTVWSNGQEPAVPGWTGTNRMRKGFSYDPGSEIKVELVYTSVPSNPPVPGEPAPSTYTVYPTIVEIIPRTDDESEVEVEIVFEWRNAPPVGSAVIESVTCLQREEDGDWWNLGTDVKPTLDQDTTWYPSLEFTDQVELKYRPIGANDYVTIGPAVLRDGSSLFKFVGLAPGGYEYVAQLPGGAEYSVGRFFIGDVYDGADYKGIQVDENYGVVKTPVAADVAVRAENFSTPPFEVRESTTWSQTADNGGPGWSGTNRMLVPLPGNLFNLSVNAEIVYSTLPGNPFYPGAPAPATYAIEARYSGTETVWDGWPSAIFEWDGAPPVEPGVVERIQFWSLDVYGERIEHGAYIQPGVNLARFQNPILSFDAEVTLQYRPAGSRDYVAKSAFFGDSSYTTFEMDDLPPGAYEFIATLKNGEICSVGKFTLGQGGSIELKKKQPGDGGASVRGAVFQRLDRWGNVIEVTDPRNEEWSMRYSYNTFNQLTQSQTVRTVTENGTTTQQVNTVAQTYYDKLGREIASRDAMSNVSKKFYDRHGQVKAEMDAEGGLQFSSYNLFGERVRLTQKVNGGVDVVTDYTYDLLGRVLTSSIADVKTVQIDNYNTGNGMNTGTPFLYTLTQSYRYDQLGRRISSTNSDNGTSRTRYDLDGNVVAVGDETGITTKYAYDNFNHKLFEMDAMGKSLSWTYDDHGKLAKYVDMSKAVISYGYDGLGRIATQKSSERGTNRLRQDIEYTYDAAGNVTAMNDLTARQLTEYEYDLAGNRVRETTTAYVQQLDVTVMPNPAKPVEFKIAELYEVMFGRHVEPHGLNDWSQRYVYSEDYAVLAQAMLDSDEARAIYADYPGIGGFLDRLFEVALGRAPDPVVRADYLARFTGHIARGEIILELIANLQPAERKALNQKVAAALHIPVPTMEVEIVVQDNIIKYDDLGRMIRVEDRGTVMEFTYDANGNRTEVKSTYRKAGFLVEQGDVVHTELFNTFDKNNRQLYVNAIKENGEYHLGEHGHLLTYDSAGNRLTDTYRRKPRDAGSMITDKYIYDNAGRLTITQRSQAGIGQNIGIDERLYDKAGRLARSGYLQNPGIPGTFGEYSFGYEGFLEYWQVASNYRTFAYNEAGRVLRQKERDFDGEELDDIYYSPDSRFPKAGYDAAGNLTGYFVVPPDGAEDEEHFYYTVQHTYLDGYRQAGLTVTRDGKSRTTNYTYDQNGNLARTWSPAMGTEKLIDRRYVNDASGHILYMTAESGPISSLVVNGELIGSTGRVSADQAPGVFTNTFRSATEVLESASPFVYVVRDAEETLQTIAKMVWGDSSLWYLIADANGLTDASLEVGMQLQMPARVTTVRNDYETYKPYDRTGLDGNLTPTLPVPSGAGCGPVGTIVTLVIFAVLSYVAPWGTTAWAAMAYAAIASAAGQVAAIAVGEQEEFNWKSVALSAISAGVGAGVGHVMGSTTIAERAMTAAVSNALTQKVAVKLDLQESFDWRGVVAAAVGSAAQDGITVGLAGTDFAATFGPAAVKGVASFGSNLASQIARGGKISVAAALVDGFGNALAAGVVGAIAASDSATRASTLEACFLPGTLIHTRKGLRPIEDIRPGDQVAARHQTMSDGPVHWGHVNEIYQHADKPVVELVVQVSSGQTDVISTTLEHPFYVIGSGWTPTAELRPGVIFAMLDGETGILRSIELSAGRHTVHNFSVQDDHTYFVGRFGIWVHNEYKTNGGEVKKTVDAPLYGNPTKIDGPAIPLAALPLGTDVSSIQLQQWDNEVSYSIVVNGTAGNYSPELFFGDAQSIIDGGAGSIVNDALVSHEDVLKANEFLSGHRQSVKAAAPSIWHETENASLPFVSQSEDLYTPARSLLGDAYRFSWNKMADSSIPTSHRIGYGVSAFVMAVPGLINDVGTGIYNAPNDMYAGYKQMRTGYAAGNVETFSHGLMRSSVGLLNFAGAAGAVNGIVLRNRAAGINANGNQYARSTYISYAPQKVSPPSVTYNINLRSSGANSSLLGTAANGPVFAPNLNGLIRTEAEAVALAAKYGVQISDDVVIKFVPDEWLLNKVGAKAEYSQLGKGNGGNISWEDLMMTEGPHAGKIPVRFGNSLLASDEAIVGHIGHEMFELNKFEAIGSMSRANFAKQIAADPIQFPNNWHSQAWDYSHELMKLMRGIQ